MSRWSSLLAVACGAAVMMAAGAARADLLSDCGGAVLDGNETCNVEASASCEGNCTPPNLEVACSAMLEAGCMGNCTATLPSCQESCEGSCMADCTATAPMISCQGNCEATCQGNCSATCSGTTLPNGEDQETCMAQCNASCGARCNVSCMGTPGMVSCAAGCSASCQGSCSGQANLSCDVMCQAQGSAMCTAMLQGGCQASCNANGALFCNGNFINASDLQSCENEIKSLLPTITLNAEASGEASCDGGECQASGQAAASVACDMAPGNDPPFSGGLMGIGLGAVIAAGLRRRVKRA